jgi:dTDP-4-amino-4,6-dideoxygalactose transaminase
MQEANFTRNHLATYLEEKGIDTRTLFSSMPTQCPGFRFLGAKAGAFPNAEYIGNNGLHLGIHQDLGKEECDYILSSIAEFIGEHAT